MRALGLLLLAAGVGVAAAFGARLSPPAAEEAWAKGRAALLAEAAEAARERYCEALGGPSRDEAACGKKPNPSAAAPDGLSPELGKLRQAWQRAARAAEEAKAEAAKVHTPAPGVRLSSWFSLGGTFFLLGIGLIVVGAVLTRRADREVARKDERSGGEGEAPAILREAIEALAGDVEALLGRMEKAAAEAAWNAIKDELERLRYERIEPTVEARDRYQRQLGLERFAMAFGPFSSAERALYRAWSALVDGYREEAVQAVRTARQRLQEALAELGEAAA